MFSERKNRKQRFEPDWKEVFERDFCDICKNRNCCPINWKCHDMKIFIKENEKAHENLDNDDTL